MDTGVRSGAVRNGHHRSPMLGERLPTLSPVTSSGVRRWPGMFVHFTILSNDLDSAEYKQALDVMKSGIREK